MAKAGTTHFHAYATAIVVHKGHRYTLALTYVQYGEAMKNVVQRLLQTVRRRGVNIKFLLLDKGFFSVSVISYLRRAGYGFIIPAIPRGRKPKPPQKLTGLRALRKKNNGYYPYTLTGKDNNKQRSVRITICVASKRYVYKKTGERRTKKLLYAVWQVRRTPRDVRETYRQRFGIETSYRQMNEARIRTCTRDPKQRLLFIGIALVLRNVWVWLHFKLAKGKWDKEPKLFLELLPFKEMLLWLTQVMARHLHANQSQGIQRETYERLTKNYH